MAQREYRELSCRDAGLDCDFLIRAESEEEIMSLASQHACSAHHLCEETPEMKSKIHNAIRRVWCDGDCHSTPEPKFEWRIPTLG